MTIPHIPHSSTTIPDSRAPSSDFLGGAAAPLSAGLYLVATPIGNLRDITLRALETLSAADVLLCEDTRVTRRLLSHYGIKAPEMHTYTDFSEGKNSDLICDRIRAGASVVLVSDAGMPMISDPGYRLVQDVIAAGLPVTSCPGANAVLMALQLSGLPTDSFVFLGFLPTKSGERRRKIEPWAAAACPLIFYESANRAGALLSDLEAVLGDRSGVVARELTKMFEEVRRGNLSVLQQSLAEKPIKGEVVVLVAGAQGQFEGEVSDADLDRLLRAAMGSSPLRVAVDAVTRDTGLPRKQVYARALALREGS